MYDSFIFFFSQHLIQLEIAFFAFNFGPLKFQRKVIEFQEPAACMHACMHESHHLTKQNRIQKGLFKQTTCTILPQHHFVNVFMIYLK